MLLAAWLAAAFLATQDPVVIVGNADTPKLGSGVIVDPRGYIVTAQHVVGTYRQFVVHTRDQQKHTADLVAVSMRDDLAILKLQTERRFVASRIAAADPCVRQRVYVVGHPHVKGEAYHDYSWTTTEGIVSGVGRTIWVNDSVRRDRLFQIDAAINPGNSGGPAYCAQSGEVVGIICLMREGSQRIGFMTGAAAVRQFVKQATEE